MFLLFTAKKNKKKGKTLTLTDFLAEDSGGSAPPVYSSAKPTSWADETDDLDGEGEHKDFTPVAMVMRLSISIFFLFFSA